MACACAVFFFFYFTFCTLTLSTTSFSVHVCAKISVLLFSCRDRRKYASDYYATTDDFIRSTDAVRKIMPFADRPSSNKSKFSDSVRGKSTDEILEEIKRQFGNNVGSSMFFDNSDSRTSPERVCEH